MPIPGIEAMIRDVTTAMAALLPPCRWQVGSAEGWTPSAFTSSRDKRAAPREQRPEDFMDDEDGLLTEQLQVQRTSRTVFAAVVHIVQGSPKTASLCRQRRVAYALSDR